MRFSDVQQWLGRLLVILVFVVLGLPEVGFGKEAAGGSPLSMTDIVKQATQQSAAGHRIEKLANGLVRVPSPVQAIEAVAAPEGVIVTSTKKDRPGRFAIRAESLGRTGGSTAAVTPGAVSVDKDLARIVHPGLSEELTTSADGIRQDFLVPAAPQGKGELVLELSFSGAALRKSGGEVELALPEGRKFLYRQLHVTDKNGKVLPARFELQCPNRLRIVVADAGAVYPVRIDPTITDANWVSITLPDTDGDITTLLYAGGNLYAGGRFTGIGGNVAMYIAKWDGSSWLPFGSAMDGPVNALAWDGANLYAGGGYSDAYGYEAVGYVVKWDGSSWLPLGSGINDTVTTLAWDGGNLYAGGEFTSAGGNNANHIAKWDGNSWSALGKGMDGSVNALAWDGVNLYAGGFFFNAGGASANHIAKWDGSSWLALGSGMNDAVFALAWGGGNLYAGGEFTSAGGNNANHIAKWDGNSWSTLGSGVHFTDFYWPAVHALAWDGANLYAGGWFNLAGGTSANNIAKWNGNSWSALGSGTDNDVTALAWAGSNFYAGGRFTIAGGNKVSRIARWNGRSWSALGRKGMDGDVYALAWGGSNLYAGGDFTTTGGGGANSIAKWNGKIWAPLGSGINGVVATLAWDGVNLYAGGLFSTAGGINANNIAKWDGNSWSALGSGMNDVVNALVWDGVNLYAGGWFETAGGKSVNYIAKWDGNSWSAVGSGLSGEVKALAWDGANLYAGGYFFFIVGENYAKDIAKWDGSSWLPLGSGVDYPDSYPPTVNALAWDGANLYAGGDFSIAGGVSANNIAKWDGSFWSSVGSGINGEVNALAWDGTNLFAGGAFTSAGGTSANSIVKWDGSSWSAMGSGMIGRVEALAWHDANLYVGGWCSSAGGKPARLAYLSPVSLPLHWNVKPAAAYASYKGEKGTITFTVTGGTASAEVSASTAAPWLTITSPSTVTLKNGKGSGKVTWVAEPNPASTTRDATITIGTQAVTVTQAAAPCVVKLTPTSISEKDNAGGTATITLTAPDACGWAVSSEKAPWISPTPSSGIGAGTITLDIAANTTGKKRNGKVTVTTEAKSASLTVKQPK